MAVPEKRQFVINDQSQIPPGYIRLADLGCRGKNKPGSTEWNVLHRAWTKGEISGVKLMKTVRDSKGEIWVNKDEADAILQRTLGSAGVSGEPQRAIVEADAAPEMQLLEHVADMRASLSRSLAYLGDMYDALKVIARATEATAKAVEDMATRPGQ